MGKVEVAEDEPRRSAGLPRALQLTKESRSGIVNGNRHGKASGDYRKGDSEDAIGGFTILKDKDRGVASG